MKHKKEIYAKMKRKDFGESMSDETKLRVLNFVERQLRVHFQNKINMENSNDVKNTTNVGNDFIADVSTRYSYLEIQEILKSQIDYMIQCVQDSEGTIDPSEDINDIEITLNVLKHVYNVC